MSDASLFFSYLMSIWSIWFAKIIMKTKMIRYTKSERRNVMGKKNKTFILNRKDYNRIRKMDHNQMILWAESVYKSGFEDGKAMTAEGTLTKERIEEALLKVKGLSKKRISAICNELEKLY